MRTQSMGTLLSLLFTFLFSSFSFSQTCPDPNAYPDACENCVGGATGEEPCLLSDLACPEAQTVFKDENCQASVPDISGTTRVGLATTADFGSEQGNPWYYGAMNFGDYRNFQQLPNFDSTANVWNSPGNGFDLPSLDPDGGHPEVSPGAKQAVRRWISTVNGDITLEGDFFDRNTGCGDGVHVFIYKNGQNIYEYLDVPGNSVPYSLTTNVSFGDTIDFAIDRKFDGGCDDTHFTNNIFVDVTQSQIPLAGTPITSDTTITLTTSTASGSEAECIVSLAVLEGSTSCPPCQPGFFDNGGVCSLCPPGSFCPGDGNAYLCDAGSFSTDSGAVACSLCPPGRFSATQGATECTACSAGFFQPDPGATSCIACSAGTAQNSEGAVECTSCPPGTFTSGDGFAECELCPSGTFQNQTGQTSCIECDAGETSEPGSATCEECSVLIQCPGNISLFSDDNSCQATASGTEAVVTSNCDTTYTYEITGATTGSGTGSVDGVLFNQGRSTVTYTTIDGSTTCSFEIFVEPVQGVSECDNCPEIPIYEGTTLNSPILVGSGISNENMIVSRNCDIELGMKAIRRFEGDFDPIINTYLFGLGNSLNQANDGVLDSLARWNYVISIDLGPYTFEDLDVNFEIDFDIEQFTPSSEKYIVDVDQEAIAAGLGGTGFLQDSQNLGFSFWQDIGDPNIVPFDPYAEAAYEFRLSVSTKDGLELAYVDMVVVVGCNLLDPAFDFEAPELTCPEDFVVDADSGVCTAILSGTAPDIFTENCDFEPDYQITGSTTASGFDVVNIDDVPFNIGNSEVTYTITDDGGNTGTCSFNVEVNDTENPAISAPPDLTLPTDPGLCIATGFDPGNPVTFDNCGIDSVYNDAPDTLAVGVNTIEWTITDISGNTSTSVQNVTVEDQEPPTVICQDITLSLSEGVATISANDIDNGSFDNCGIQSLSLDVTEFTSGDTGDNTVVLTATDFSGNQSTCQATVTIADGIPPTAICQNVTVELDQNGIGILSPDQVDNGSFDDNGMVSLSLDDTLFDCSDISAASGDIVLINEFHYDNAGADVNEFVEIAASFDASGYGIYLYNGSNGEVYDQLDTLGAPNSSVDGINYYLWTPSSIQNGPDGIALVDDQGQVVEFISYEGPVTAVDGPAAGFSADELPFASENSGTPVGSSIARSLEGSVPSDFLWFSLVDETPGLPNLDQVFVLNTGGNSVTLTVTDGAGNQSTCTAEVTVVDLLGPELLCTDWTIFLGTGGEATLTTDEVVISAEDNCTPVELELSKEFFDCTDLEIVQDVTVTATDEYGNVSTCTQVVVAVDFTDPVAECNDAVIEVDENGQAILEPADIDNGSGDVCGNVDLSLDKTLFDCSDVNTDGLPVAEDLFISEYLEGSGSNKYIEIYNGTGEPVDLSDYELRLYSNGSSTPTTTSADGFTGLLNDGEALVLANSAATLTGFVSVDNAAVNFNGDDAVELFNLNTGNPVDIFGVIGEDPGTEWVGAVNNTQDVTLRRIGTVTSGNTSNAPGFPSLDTEWEAASNNNSIDLEQHELLPSGLSSTVTLTATDEETFTSTCTADVTVIDLLAPTVVCQNLTLALDENGNASMLPTDIDGGSSDNCGIDSLSLDRNSFTCSDLGTNTVNLTAFDFSGNSASCSATVTVIDTIAPQVICSDITIPLSDTIVSISPEDIDNGSFDNCGIANLILDVTTFTAANIGANTVNLTAVDSSGNQSACSATVTVEDSGAPTAICQDITVSLGADGTVGITPEDIDNGSFDGEGDVSLSLDVVQFDCSDLGENQVTLTATDQSNNSSTCTATVTVENIESATLTCPGDIVLFLDSGSCQATAVGADPNIVANCDSSLTYEISGATSGSGSGSVNGLTFNQGLSRVTYIANQGGDTCSFNVFVEPTQGPSTCDACTAGPQYGATLSGPIIIGSGISNEEMAVAEYCDIELGIKAIRRFLGDISPMGDTYQVGTGLSPTSASATETDPDLARWNYVLSIDLGNYTFEDLDVSLEIDWDPADDPGQAAPYVANVSQSAIDNGLGNTGFLQDSQNLGFDFWQLLGDSNILPFDPYAEGVYDFRISVKTPAGVELAFTDMRVEVGCEFVLPSEDLEAPEITCSDDVILSADSSQCSALLQSSELIVFTDNCDTIPDFQIAGATNLTGQGSVSGTEFNVGLSTVTYTLSDEAGNTGTCTFTVMVEDGQAPVLEAPTDLVVNTDAGLCSASNVGLGDPSASDNCAIDTVFNDAPEIFAIGNTTVTYTAIDESGNLTTASQIVTVEDQEPPVLVAPSDITVDADSGLCSAMEIIQGSPVASDNCGIDSISNDAPSVFPTGVTEVVFTAVDLSGNIATDTTIVTVIDGEAPIVQAPEDLILSADSGLCSSFSPDIGLAQASDNCGVDTVFNDAPEEFPIGSTTVTYTVVDAAGNQSTDTQIVIVEDNELPVITCPADILVETDQGQCTALVNYSLPSASDNCGIDSIIQVSGLGSGSEFPTGSTEEVYEVVDVHGNVSTCSFLVTVEDTELPVIACPTNISVNNNPGICGATVNYLVPNGADNCPGAEISQVSGLGSGAVFPVGTSTEEYRITDAAGNVSECSFSINVIDVEAPVADCADATIQLDENGEASIAPEDLNGNSTDNCGVDSLSVSQTLFTEEDLGVNQVSLTVYDASGNTTICIGAVQVLPFEEPCVVEGGNITTEDQRSNLCVGDGESDIINVEVTGNTGFGRFGLINASTNDVVTSNVTGVFNMEAFPAGDYFIVYASVEDLSQFVGVQNTSDLEGCFDISNFISVSSFFLQAGTISTLDETNICNDDAILDKPDFDVSGQFGPNGRFAVLNSAGTQVLANNATGVFNFDLAPAGTYQVVHVVYGNIPPSSINISNPTGCVAISDPIIVTVSSCGTAANLSSNPNPTDDISFVEFTVPENQNVLLEVYDASGRFITSIHNAEAIKDTPYRFEFSGGHLPNGIYLYRLTTETEVIIDKFMIAR